MRHLFLCFQLIGSLTVGLGANHVGLNKALTLKKVYFSAEAGYYRTEFYFYGDLDLINTFPYPVFYRYIPKIRIGYYISPKMSVEIAFHRQRHVGTKGFTTQSGLFWNKEIDLLFNSNIYELGIRYTLISYSNSYKTILLSWNPSAVFEYYSSNLNTPAKSTLGSPQNTTYYYQHANHNLYVRNEFFLEKYCKTNHLSLGVGISYKFNPIFKKILSTAIEYNKDGTRLTAYNYSYGNQLQLFFLRFTYYVADRKAIYKFSN